VLHRLRGEIKFDGVDALVAAIADDVQKTRDYFAARPL
jgi:FAD synthase